VCNGFTCADRGADSFEVFCHFVAQQADWVVRASSLHRVILTPDAEEVPLSAYLLTLPLAARTNETPRASRTTRADAKLEVRFGKLQMPAPAQQSPYVKTRNLSSIEMWVVEVREVDAPQE